MDSTLTAFITGLCMLAADKAITWFRDRRTDSREASKLEAKAKLDASALEAKAKLDAAQIAIPANEQALKIFRELVENLRTDLIRTEEANRLLEKQLLECREKEIISRTELELCKRSMLSGKKPTKNTPLPPPGAE